MEFCQSEKVGTLDALPGSDKLGFEYQRQSQLKYRHLWTDLSLHFDISDPRERELHAAAPGPGGGVPPHPAPVLGHHQRGLPAQHPTTRGQRRVLRPTQRAVTAPPQVGRGETRVKIQVRTVFSSSCQKCNS